MLPPNVINGATLKTHFSPHPMSKRGLVIRIQERKGIAENQDHGYKRKQKQRKADGVEQCFHFEIVMLNCESVPFDFRHHSQVLI
jgi:hypothetical protein